MDSFPKKPCKYCGKHGHFPYMCRYNPKRKERAKKEAAEHRRWLLTRQTWIRKNPPTIGGRYWPCYLKIDPRCPGRVHEKNMTLDHVIPRSRDQKKTHDLDNLKPACWYCNLAKGSYSIESLEREYGRQMK